MYISHRTSLAKGLIYVDRMINSHKTRQYAVAGKPRDAAVNFDRYTRIQSVQAVYFIFVS